MDLTEVEVFIPDGGPEDAEREAFLDAAEELLEEGLPITVYSRGTHDWAFEECEHVADMVAASGEQVLPITLLGPQIVASWTYPTAEQMRRFARARVPKRKDPRFSSTGAACGPGGGAVGMPGAGGPAAGARIAGAGIAAGGAGAAGTQGPAGFAATLAGVRETPRGGPDIGIRRNLMGGDVGDGLPEADAEADAQQGGGCCGGSCGCGSH